MFVAVEVDAIVEVFVVVEQVVVVDKHVFRIAKKYINTKTMTFCLLPIQLKYLIVRFDSEVKN